MPHSAPRPSGDRVLDLLAFLDASPTPYHAVAEVERRLRAAGFTELDERQPWTLTPGARHFVVRGGGTLAAFRLGQRPAADHGLLLLGAHTDSPTLRLRPRPEVVQAGADLLMVEVYGGPLLHTWFDRELSLAGRVVLADGSVHLVRLPGAPCRLPSLAIHLDRGVNKEGLKLVLDAHLRPLLGMSRGGQTRTVAALVAAALRTAGGTGIGVESLVSSDLMLFDAQPAALAGVDGDLLCSGRLDNLVSCHAALTALLEADARDATQVILLHDHEEVGSETAAGARSRFAEGLLSRLVAAVGGSGPETMTAHALERALARALLVSVDMAHAVHPNHPDRHDERHGPWLGAGPVLKSHSAQSYATEAPAQAIFVAACRATGSEPQRYVARNELRCGSTIGPLVAARLGIRTVDVGSPLLGMHSCRETCDVRDVEPMIQALRWVLSSAEPPPSRD